MIIWINGAFGAGKTTAARGVAAALDDAAVVNVEKIGTMIRALVPKHLAVPDFQDDPLWCETVVGTLLSIVRRDSGIRLIVPMTLVNADYFDAIVGDIRRRGVDLRHVTLALSELQLRRRIRRQWFFPPAARRFRLSRAEECVAALRDDRFREHIDASQPKAQVVDDVLRAVGLTRS